MSKIITIYKLQCIKESSHKYEVESKIGAPRDAYNIFQEVFHMSEQAEELLSLLVLNSKNVVIGTFEVHRGSLNSSIVHPREVFKRALAVNGASIIIAHNHPSGETAPSNEDINITARIKESGKILGVELLDHLIIGDESYLSFKEKGIL